MTLYELTDGYAVSVDATMPGSYVTWQSSSCNADKAHL